SSSPPASSSRARTRAWRGCASSRRRRAIARRRVVSSASSNRTPRSRTTGPRWCSRRAVCRTAGRRRTRGRTCGCAWWSRRRCGNWSRAPSSGTPSRSRRGTGTNCGRQGWVEEGRRGGRSALGRRAVAGRGRFAVAPLAAPAVRVADAVLLEHALERGLEVDALFVGDGDEHEQDVRQLQGEVLLRLAGLLGFVAVAVVQLARQLAHLLHEPGEVG